MKKILAIFSLSIAVILTNATNHRIYAADEAATESGAHLKGPNETKGGKIGERVGGAVGAMTTNPRDSYADKKDHMNTYEEGGRVTGEHIGRQIDKAGASKPR